MSSASSASRSSARHTTRSQQKERTRRALLDAALELGKTGGGLARVSLRQVTRAVGIVPTAFYRHFTSVDELGLALVTESFTALRNLMRELRSGDRPTEHMIDDSVAAVLADVRSHRAHYGFIVREEAAGVAEVQQAVRHELELIQRELATDLARLVPDWPHDDIADLAHLAVGVLVITVREILMGEGDRTVEDTAAARAVRQLHLILAGARAWRADPGSL